MKPMLSKTTRFTTWLSSFLNRNTGWLIATAIVFFGLYNLGFSKENRILIENTEGAAQSSEQAAMDAKHAAEDAKKILEGQGKAVAELKAHAEKQTALIICMLAIHGETTAISEADAENCHVVVAEAEANPTYDPSSESPPAGPEEPGFLDDGDRVGPQPEPSPNQPPPPAQDEPTIPILGDLDDLLERLLGPLDLIEIGGE